MAENKIRQIGAVLGTSGRQNKYRVSFAWPRGLTGVSSLEEVDVLAKSATAPQKEIGIIELWNQGRKLVIPGDTTYDNVWALDFYLSEDHAIRYDMLKWQQACDNFHSNIHTGQPDMIFADLRLEQLDSAGNVSAQYTMHNCWPSVVGEVSYDDSAENSPTEFSTTFTYTDFVTGVGETDDCDPMTATKNATGLSC